MVPQKSNQGMRSPLTRRSIPDALISNCSTSIVIRTSPEKPLSAHALFCSITEPSGKTSSPEAYARPDGTIYVCGAGIHDRTASLPPASQLHTLGHFAPAAEALRERMKFISPSHFDDAVVEVEQACFRPNSGKTGAPLVGKISPGYAPHV